MKFGEIVYMMMPIILVASFYSVSNFWACRILRMNIRFKALFMINAYATGTYLLLHGVLFAYSMLLAGLHDRLKQIVLSLALLVMHLIIGALILVVFYRYYRLLCEMLGAKAGQCIVLLLLSLLIFTILFVPILMLVFPILPQVWK